MKTSKTVATWADDVEALELAADDDRWKGSADDAYTLAGKIEDVIEGQDFNITVGIELTDAEQATLKSAVDLATEDEEEEDKEEEDESEGGLG